MNNSNTVIGKINDLGNFKVNFSDLKKTINDIEQKCIKKRGSTMNTYHKIKTVYNRDPETKYKTLLDGDFALPEFEYLKNNNWQFSEKIDGTNIRVMYNDLDVGSYSIKFGGKTDRAQLPADLANRLNEIFLPQVDLFCELFETTEVCFYGEGYGPKIQKGGGNYRKDQDFVLFDIKIGRWWLQRQNVEEIAGKFGLDIVPIIATGTLDDMVDMVKTGFNSQWGDFQAEGIVARPEVELKARNGGRIITKLKCKDFKN